MTISWPLCLFFVAWNNLSNYSRPISFTSVRKVIMNNIHLTAQQKLLLEIEEEVSGTASYTGVYKLSSKVYEALRKVPREDFVSSTNLSAAYLNRALPIGEGQTISQPYIVALMTELLDIQPSDKVLEIGTGSGYQAAILSCLASKVYTVEVIPSLANQAKERLERHGYENISTLVSNGASGWPEYAPYDKIIVTAAAEEIPLLLLEQLAPKGKMVIPLGKQSQTQELTLVEKNLSGEITCKAILPVVFVPFVQSKKYK